jgi:hypothetical protein
MKKQTSVACYSAGLWLALMGLMSGFSAPGYCQERPLSDPRTIALVTAGGWVPTGNLSTPRYGHTATLLPNGKVLVVGGATNGNILDSSE